MKQIFDDLEKLNIKRKNLGKYHQLELKITEGFRVFRRGRYEAC